jgi:hypothetical protein
LYHQNFNLSKVMLKSACTVFPHPVYLVFCSFDLNFAFMNYDGLVVLASSLCISCMQVQCLVFYGMYSICYMVGQ